MKKDLQKLNKNELINLVENISIYVGREYSEDIVDYIYNNIDVNN
tara:strand:+ start:65 stop:199 length:135 start_codon:yes stop_codon:yes gene_type:complete